MADNNKHNAKLGLFISIGLVIFIFGVLAIGNINNAFKKSIQIVAIFNQVNGLQAGDNVWLSGVKVGTVKDMQFLSNANVIVTINLEQKLQSFIPQDAFAKISSDGLIGNKLIVIFSGEIKNGAIQSNDTLRVENSITNEDMLATLQENNTNILAITGNLKLVSENLASGDGTLGKLLQDETLYQNLASTIASLQNTSARLNTMSASLDNFSSKLNNPENLAGIIVDDTAIVHQIESMVVNLNSFSDLIVATGNDIREVSKNLNENNTSVVGVLLNDENAAIDLKEALKHIENSTQKLNENMEALQHNILFRKYFKNKAE
jgi:phospholipid/cholesterol/gamma-HCH transport system substrate-binding protein